MISILSLSANTTRPISKMIAEYSDEQQTLTSKNPLLTEAKPSPQVLTHL
jgi:hypothetical protein